MVATEVREEVENVWATTARAVRGHSRGIGTLANRHATVRGEISTTHFFFPTKTSPVALTAAKVERTAEEEARETER